MFLLGGIEKTTMASNRQYKGTAPVFFWKALEPLLELRGLVQEGVANPALVHRRRGARVHQVLYNVG